MAPPLSLDGENPVQRGGGDPQALGGGDVVFHCLVHLAAADHQHTGAPEVVAGHVDAVLVLLGDAVLQEQRQEQQGADRGKTRVVHLTAPAGRVLGVLILVLAPGGGDIGQRSFHGKSFLPAIPGIK